jgi:hypothetical protein
MSFGRPLQRMVSRGRSSRMDTGCVRAGLICRLYRGITPPLVGVTPIFAISFWGYDVGKRIVYAATPSRKSQTLSIGELAIAGGLSAVPATLVAGPAERVKVLLQVRSCRLDLCGRSRRVLAHCENCKPFWPDGAD